MLQLDGGRIQFGSSLVVGSPPQAQDHRKYQRSQKGKNLVVKVHEAFKSPKVRKVRKSQSVKSTASFEL